MSFYDDHVLPRIINLTMNTKEDRKVRSRVCAGLTGEVVEVGFGSLCTIPDPVAVVAEMRRVPPEP